MKKKNIFKVALCLRSIQFRKRLQLNDPTPRYQVGRSVGGWVVAHRGVMEEASGGAREDVIRRFD